MESTISSIFLLLCKDLHNKGTIIEEAVLDLELEVIILAEITVYTQTDTSLLRIYKLLIFTRIKILYTFGKLCTSPEDGFYLHII